MNNPNLSSSCMINQILRSNMRLQKFVLVYKVVLKGITPTCRLFVCMYKQILLKVLSST